MNGIDENRESLSEFEENKVTSDNQSIQTTIAAQRS